jgi:hypothetical protein
VPPLWSRCDYYEEENEMSPKKTSRIDDQTTTKDQAPYANYVEYEDDLSDVFMVDQKTLESIFKKSGEPQESLLKAFVSNKSPEEARKLLGSVNKMIAKEDKSLSDLLKEGDPDFQGDSLEEDVKEEDKVGPEMVTEESEEDVKEEEPEEVVPEEIEEAEEEKPELNNYNIGRLLVVFKDQNLKHDLKRALEEAEIPDSSYNFSVPSFSMTDGIHRKYRCLINSFLIPVESKEKLEDMFDDLLSELGSYFRKGYMGLESEGPFKEEMNDLIKKVK